MQARYVHTNLVARDWRRLADFYKQVFGCVPVLPERDLAGDSFDAATNVESVRIRGVHLRLPGYNEGGPTLEIFEYSPEGPESLRKINSTGFAHIAFQVDDVEAARRAVLDAGGREYGQVVRVSVPGAGLVTFVYMTDPEGNAIELQSWSR